MGELGSGVFGRLEAIGRAHGFSAAATLCLHRALAAGGGMAQFSHPELGGLGQWAGGGMIMIGEMGNPELRRRVAALCAGLAAEAERVGADEADHGTTAWWPAGLGRPASTGTQGDVSYAWFPDARQLAVRHGGRVALYDTGGHAISGLSQDGGAVPALRLNAGGREIALSDLVVVGEPERGRTRQGVEAGPAGEGDAQAGTVAAGQVREGSGWGAGVPVRLMDRADDPIATIERLSALHARGVLTEQEFTDKKMDLLARV